MVMGLVLIVVYICKCRLIICRVKIDGCVNTSSRHSDSWTLRTERLRFKD